MTKPYTYLIKNAKIIDGSGNPWYLADVAIKDKKINRIQANIPSEEAETVIDAKGNILSPGFIDAHTHDDFYVLSEPNADGKVRQGITTTISGNCGFSVAPIQRDQLEILASYQGLLGGETILDKFSQVNTFAEYLELLDENKPGINIASYVGNVTLRTTVMGHAMRKPTKEEMDQMKGLLEESMLNGALGLSSGLIYAPGSYASTEELIELCEVLKPYGGIYASHIRGESGNLLNSIQEAIQVSRSAGVQLQISHFKASGKNNWGNSQKAIELIQSAREEGLQIYADQYPYNAGSTGLFALLPPDVLAEGIEALSLKLKQASFRSELRQRVESKTADGMLKEAGYEDIMIASCPSQTKYEGKIISQIAEEENKDPLDIIFDLVSENQLAVTMVIFQISEEDIKNIMQQDFVMMGSDGLPPCKGAKVHPRMFGTAPRLLGKYVREDKVLSLPYAIRRMTSLPAQTFNLKHKGLLKEGFDADMVLFDPQTVADGATYENPFEAPIGIQAVFVNGKLAVENGEIKGARSGEVIRYAK